MVLKQKRTNTDVLIIDASKGYTKEGKNNKLRASDIKRIVDAVVAREDIPKFCKKVSRDTIRANEYNLKEYVGGQPDDCIDIVIFNKVCADFFLFTATEQYAMRQYYSHNSVGFNVI